MKAPTDRVAQNVLALLSGRAATLLISAASAVILTRVLGPTDYGVYASVFALLSLFGWAASFGLDALLPGLVARHRGLLPSLLFTATLLSAVSSVLATGLAAVVGYALGYRGQLLVVLFLAAFDVLLLAPARLAGAVHQADLRQWLPVGIGIARQVFWLLALVGIAAADAGLLWVLFARALAGILEASLLFVTRYPRLERSRGPRIVRPAGLARGALPLALNALAVAVYHRADQTILFHYSGSEVVGHYALATSTVELLNALPNAVMASLFPLLAAAHRNAEHFRDRLAPAFRMLTVAVLFACLVVAAAGPEMVGFVYGPSYARSAPLLQVLVWSELTVCTGTIISGALIARGMQRYLPLSTTVGAVLNVGGNLLLVPIYGPMAAAWVTVCSYTMAGLILFLLIPQTRDLARMACSAIALPLIVALTIAVGAALIPVGPIFRALMSSTALGVFLFLLSGPLRRDAARIARVFLRLGDSSSPSA